MSSDLSEVKLYLVESLEEAWDFKRWLGERHENDLIACDTETGGFNYKRDPLRLVQFGDTMKGWSIPWDDWRGLVKEVLSEYEGEIAFHNAPFDVKFLEHNTGLKMPWRHINDTMIMAHIADPTRSIALKQLCARLIDSRAIGAQRNLDEAMSKNKWSWATVPLDFGPYWQYAAMDTVLTSRLFAYFEGIRREFADVYQLEMATLRITSEMERRGSRIDLDYTDKKRLELQEFVDSAHEWGREAHGCNIGSNEQVTRRLIEMGYPLTERTGAGRWKFDKEVIQGILGLDDRDNPIREVDESSPAVVLTKATYQARKAQKVISTYLENFLSMHEDELLHPSIKTVGARTARMSITAPALQTLPRGPLVRDCFIPREGNVLISTDYDQIEMRLMGHFSEDQGLYDAFHSGDDFFTTLARRIYDDPTMDKDDPRRQLTKNAAYGKAYGAGITKLAATAKVSYEQMKGVNDAFDALYPGVRNFQRQVERIATQRFAETGEAYVLDPFGRRQVADGDKAYTLVNYLLQGTAGSILKKALVNLSMAGLDEYLLLPIHDEVILDVPRDVLADAKVVIKDSMEGVGNWKIPLTAGIDVIEERWGDKYRKKDK